MQREGPYRQKRLLNREKLTHNHLHCELKMKNKIPLWPGDSQWVLLEYAALPFRARQAGRAAVQKCDGAGPTVTIQQPCLFCKKKEGKKKHFARTEFT